MTTNECKIAIHLVLESLGENSLTQTGPQITQKAQVNPNMNLIEQRRKWLLDTENIKHATAFAIIEIPNTKLALLNWKVEETNKLETERPK